MKTLGGILLLVGGIVLIIISIFTLIRVFTEFEALSGGSMADYGYSFGKLFFPLLLTVLGRYMYRKGKAKLRPAK
jgi:hypothetical protein